MHSIGLLNDDYHITILCILLQGTGRGESQTYPDSLEWVSILFTWHVAGNFVLFVLALLASCHVCRSRALGGRGDDCDGCLQVRIVGALKNVQYM